MERRASKWGRGAALALVLPLPLACTGVFVAACFPDLSPLKEEASETSTTKVAFRFCGDGIIESLDDGGDAGESCDPGDASVAGCSNCQVTCSGTIDDAGAHCYFALAPTTSFTAALSQCESTAAHLVTIDSDREETLVQALVDGGTFWVGLEDRPALGAYVPTSTVREPGYPRFDSTTTCSGCYARGTDGGAIPLSSELDAATTAACVASENGAWALVPCSATRELATVCEREPLGTRTEYCNGPFCTRVPATAGTKTYLVSLAESTASDAKLSCEAQGGRLVVLGSREERQQLVHEILTLLESPASVWIGLARDEVGTWRWDDGAPSLAHPTAWGAGQPGARTLTTSRAYLHIDNSAFDTQLAYAETNNAALRPFVCERGVGP